MKSTLLLVFCFVDGAATSVEARSGRYEKLKKVFKEAQGAVASA